VIPIVKIKRRYSAVSVGVIENCVRLSASHSLRARKSVVFYPIRTADLQRVVKKGARTPWARTEAIMDLRTTLL
jgi:hypothetical protein